MDVKLEEFSTNERFMMRIHSLFFINKIAPVVSPAFINAKIVPILLRMAKDPVPNIRFNVSKTTLLIAKNLTVSNHAKMREEIRTMAEGDSDFDAQFFAQQTLEQI